MVQKGILAPVPKQACYLSFAIAPEMNPAGSLRNRADKPTVTDSRGAGPITRACSRL